MNELGEGGGAQFRTEQWSVSFIQWLESLISLVQSGLTDAATCLTMGGMSLCHRSAGAVCFVSLWCVVPCFLHLRCSSFFSLPFLVKHILQELPKQRVNGKYDMWRPYMFDNTLFSYHIWLKEWVTAFWVGGDSQNFEGIPSFVSFWLSGLSLEALPFWLPSCTSYFFFPLSLKAVKVFSSLAFWNFTMIWVWLCSLIVLNTSYSLCIRAHMFLNLGKLSCIIL